MNNHDSQHFENLIANLAESCLSPDTKSVNEDQEYSNEAGAEILSLIKGSMGSNLNTSPNHSYDNHQSHYAYTPLDLSEILASGAYHPKEGQKNPFTYDREFLLSKARANKSTEMPIELVYKLAEFPQIKKKPAGYYRNQFHSNKSTFQPNVFGGRKRVIPQFAWNKNRNMNTHFY